MGFGDSPPPAALSRYTGFLLSWVAARSRTRFEAALEDLDLRLQHFALMSVVAAEPGLTQQDLVGKTHIDPSTMVQTLDALAESGNVERRPHHSDRRKHTVHLTAQGETTLEEAREAAKSAGRETLGRLDAAERKELQRMLRKIAGLDEGKA
ncbi:MAG: MarR family transcriptional regulator [Solirubrobacterales bacterium]|nr:MarR family transcriptional regulator [Solirubrobacterales bacterium]